MVPASRREIEDSLIGGSIPHKIYHFLQANYPGFYQPKYLSDSLELDYESVKKALQSLLKKGLIQRPNIKKKRGWYQGVPTEHNVANLEEPRVEMHNLVFQVEFNPNLLGSRKGDSPPPLYTQGNLGKNIKLSFVYDKYDHLVTFQFNPNETITVYLTCSKHPLDEAAMYGFKTWLFGALQAYGVDTLVVSVSIVRAELSKDYKMITMTPKMLELRDLEKNSWLRIYRKYWNLHRLEIGTTWEGDKKLYELFEGFGKPPVKDLDEQDLGAYR